MYSPGVRSWTIYITPLLFLAACGEDPAPDPCVDAPTYTNDIAGIVEVRCLDCHSTSKVGPARQGAPEGLNYNTYDLTQPNFLAFSNALTSGRMPPPTGGVPGTTPFERDVVDEWQRCGNPR